MKTIIGVLTFVLLAGHDRAQAAELCAARNGRLAVRESCGRRQQPVDRGTFGVPGTAGPAGAPGGRGGAASFPLRLVDANDVEVGRILDFSPAQALVEVDHATFASPLRLWVSRTRFAADTVPLLYASADCSGAPYMRSPFDDSAGLLPPVAFAFGLAAYHATGPAQGFTHGSVEYDVSPPCDSGWIATDRDTCCHPDAGSTTNVVPAARVPLAPLGLVPPFRAVAR